MATLLAMAAHIPTVPYIRLSKIERGEVVATPAELRAVAAVLEVPPERLLVEDVEQFDIAAWRGSAEPSEPSEADDRAAVLVGAALRRLRASDPALTITRITERFGVPPVILSRLENGQKPVERWNAPTIAALCAMFSVRDVGALRARVDEMAAHGGLRVEVEAIAHPRVRIEKARARISALREELAAPTTQRSPPPRRAPAIEGEAAAAQLGATTAEVATRERVDVPLVPVFGAPRDDGAIDRMPLGEWVAAPRHAGPRAFGLRLFRPTLGIGLPAGATLIADPDRFPRVGGLALLEHEGGWRVLAISLDRHGALLGFSHTPELQVALDPVAPARLAAVIAISLD